MKKKMLAGLAIGLLVLGMVTMAQGAIIVDTGEVPAGGEVALSYNNPTQWLAGQFSITQSYTITDVQGYIRQTSWSPGTLTLSIYGDGGIIPDTSTVLFRGQFTVPHPGFYGYAHDWFGISEMNLDLSAGNYWVAFEVRAGDTFDHGAMRYGAPEPLDAYAVYNPNYSSDYFSHGFDVGVKIQGNSVPLPAAVWLLGSGLIGFVGIRKKFSKT